MPLVDDSLRILQISTSDHAGGAERVAWDLFNAYRLQGYQSWLAVGKKLSDDRDVLPIKRLPVFGSWSWWCNRLYNGLSAWNEKIAIVRFLRLLLLDLASPLTLAMRWGGIENFHFPKSRSLLTLLPIKPDIVHAHNLHGGFFDLRMLPVFSRQMPFLMTLHDAWLLSGHCAHSFDCERWRIGCGHCPNLRSYPGMRRDETIYNWQRKRSIFERTRVYVATPSRWLMDKVEKSILASSVIEGRVIPNGVDTSVFKPADRLVIRKSLALPTDIPILLLAANNIQTNSFKDYETLHRTMTVLGEASKSEIWFIVLGDIGRDERIGNVLIRFMGHIADPSVVARYYQSADIYLHAARADTFPNTILESLACGTPVIATAVGGIQEQIKDGITGFLIPMGDSIAMAKCIDILLKNSALRLHMAATAAIFAHQHFSLDLQVSRYLRWYSDICHKSQLLHYRNDGTTESEDQRLTI